MRIDRMLSIIILLLNRRRITARELSERFEVSLRTVYRDIDAINLAGIPVISNQGFGGGYEIPDSYKLSRQVISHKDLKSIIAALKGMNITLEDKEIKLILEKVKSLLPGYGSNSDIEANEIIVFDTVDWGNNTDITRKIQNIYEAIKTKHVLDIAYVNMKGKMTKRQIQPQSIVQKGFAWYLYGYCRKREDTRMFKLKRIKEIQVLNEQFIKFSKPYKQFPQEWGKIRK